MSPWIQGAIGEAEIARGWKDDLLRLLFACCHPSLETGESAALCLATILGLSSPEIRIATGKAVLDGRTSPAAPRESGMATGKKNPDGDRLGGGDIGYGP